MKKTAIKDKSSIALDSLHKVNIFKKNWREEFLRMLVICHKFANNDQEVGKKIRILKNKRGIMCGHFILSIFGIFSGFVLKR